MKLAQEIMYCLLKAQYGWKKQAQAFAAAFYDWFVCLVFILKILPGEKWNKLFKIPNLSSTWLIKQMLPRGMFKFVYFWLLWVFVAVQRLSPTVVSKGYSLAVVHGLLIAVLSLVAETGSRHMGFGSCGSHALERGRAQ